MPKTPQRAVRGGSLTRLMGRWGARGGPITGLGPRPDQSRIEPFTDDRSAEMPPASASCPGAAAGANAQELSKHAWELAKAGDAEAALRCHLAATSRADANVFTYYHRAQTEMQLGLSEDGKRSFERALSPASFDAQVELVPSAATEAHFQLGKLERDAGNLAIAERHYRASIRLTPGAPGAHVMLGVTLRDQGRTPEALAAYTAGLNVQPAIPAAQYNRAQCLMGARAPRVQRTAQAHTHTPAFAPLHADPPQPFHQRMLPFLCIF